MSDDTPKMNTEDGSEKPRYRAPALAKGLQILEMLSAETNPMTLSGISQRMNRSRSEIFRMVQELEAHGYIQRSMKGEGYEITNKLFLLGMEQPRTVTLLEAALPYMRRYAAETGQSCHVAVPTEGLIVVVARIEAPGPVSFSVRLGHRQAIPKTTSGAVLFAFQPADIQELWITQFQASDPDFDANNFRRTARKIFKQKSYTRDSAFTHGVVDISAPIIRGDMAVAALTSACVSTIAGSMSSDGPPVEALRTAAAAISNAIAPH